MTGGSVLVSTLVIGCGFAGAFLFLLFMLWASGRSPVVRRLGEMIAAWAYLAGAVFQAWNTFNDDGGLTWRLVSVVLAIGAAASSYRYFRAKRQAGCSVAPSGLDV